MQTNLPTSGQHKTPTITVPKGAILHLERVTITGPLKIEYQPGATAMINGSMLDGVEIVNVEEFGEGAGHGPSVVPVWDRPVRGNEEDIQGVPLSKVGVVNG